MRHWALSLCAAVMAFVAVCGQSAADPPGAADHTWTFAEVQTTASALSTMPGAALPRLTAPSGAQLLEHLADPAVLAPCADQATPVVIRLQQCLGQMSAMTEILRAYGTAQQSDVSYSEETILMLGALLRTSAVMLVIMEEFIPTLDQNDPSYANRMRGAEQARRGCAGIVRGALTTLTTDRRLYSDAGSERFARILAESYPTLSRAATPEQKAEYDRQLAQIARTDRSPGVRAALAQYAGSN